MNPWIYQGQKFELPVNADPTNIQGFVYILINRFNGKKYIGKKFFWSSKSKQIKGKKKKFKVESDWKTYCGSSEMVRKVIDQDGDDAFTREILHLCASKGECSYWESYEIFRQQALINPDQFYNEWISCRIRRAHLKNLIISSTTHVSS
jgi:hypothetical protein